MSLYRPNPELDLDLDLDQTGPIALIAAHEFAHFVASSNFTLPAEGDIVGLAITEALREVFTGLKRHRSAKYEKLGESYSFDLRFKPPDVGYYRRGKGIVPLPRSALEPGSSRLDHSV